MYGCESLMSRRHPIFHLATAAPLMISNAAVVAGSLLLWSRAAVCVRVEAWSRRCAPAADTKTNQSLWISKAGERLITFATRFSSLVLFRSHCARALVGIRKKIYKHTTPWVLPFWRMPLSTFWELLADEFLHLAHWTHVKKLWILGF